MGTSLPTYLGQTTAANGVYSFGNSVVLEGGKQYFFYENALMPGNAYTGGAPYTQNGVYLGFVYSSIAANDGFINTAPRGPAPTFG